MAASMSFFLAAFRSSTQEENQSIATLLEIDAIARPLIDSKFPNTLEKFDISQQARFQANDPAGDVSTSLWIFQLIKPLREHFRLPYLVHRMSQHFINVVNYGIHHPRPINGMLVDMIVMN